jgi:hypothetical protein
MNARKISIIVLSNILQITAKASGNTFICTKCRFFITSFNTGCTTSFISFIFTRALFGDLVWAGADEDIQFSFYPPTHPSSMSSRKEHIACFTKDFLRKLIYAVTSTMIRTATK